MIDNKDDINSLLMCSFRYALGRNSYIVPMVLSILQRHKELMTESTRQVIKSDVQEALNSGWITEDRFLTQWLSLLQEI